MVIDHNGMDDYGLIQLQLEYIAHSSIPRTRAIAFRVSLLLAVRSETSYDQRNGNRYDNGKD